MAKTAKYRKICGRSSLSRSAHSSQRLYLGSDHLLAVEGYYRESYRRFFFRDIEAIVYRETKTGLIVNLICGTVLALSLLGILNGDLGFAVLAWIFGVPTLIVLVLNLIKGPTCSCSMVTAVQNERLDCVSRRRKFNRLLATLLPEIDSAQPAIPASEFRMRIEAALNADQAILAANQFPAPQAIRSPARPGTDTGDSTIADDRF